MRYSQSVFEKAEKELKKRREDAERLQGERALEISQLSPEIAILQQKLQNTCVELMRIVVSKDKNSMQAIENLKEKNLNIQNTIAELLKAVKGDPNYLDVQYTCKNCNDTGFHEGLRCECFEQLLKKYSADELNENCLIKLHDFSEFNLNYYDKVYVNGISPYEKMAWNLEFCKNYVDNFSSKSISMFFFGRTGLGKTFLSSCIAKALLEKNVNVVFGSIIDFFRKIEDEHFGRKEGDTLNSIISCDLLILDDLGSEFQTSFTETALYDIINSRINLLKPTIISTNLSRAEITQKYNERIVSRLTGCFMPMAFVGKDIRHLKLKGI